MNKIYRLRPAGARMLQEKSPELDRHLRRVLQLIEGDTHFEVICGWLRHYSDEQLLQWLGQLERAGLVSAEAASSSHDLDFTGSLAALKAPDVTLTETDALRIEAGAQAAGAALSAGGAYLSAERLQHRAPVAKLAAEITVMIVEDDPDQAALAERRLDLAGYRVRRAGTSKEFVAYLRSNGPPDVVLLDVELPDGDGFDILVGIRRHARLASLPVIMLTARTDPEDIRKGLRLGADGYITKPYSKTTLAEAIRRVLKHP